MLRNASRQSQLVIAVNMAGNMKLEAGNPNNTGYGTITDGKIIVVHLHMRFNFRISALT